MFSIASYISRGIFMKEFIHTNISRRTFISAVGTAGMLATLNACGAGGIKKTAAAITAEQKSSSKNATISPDSSASYAEQYAHIFGNTQARKAAEKQFDELKPSVVVVMNESFSDLSLFNELDGSYKGPEWFNSFEGGLAKGKLYVSPYGGGTCNSEWEMLTGCSMAFMGSGVYPYMVYDMSRVDNLARQLKSIGYKANAMHPNLATNWNRHIVYPAFGYDQFLSEPDFGAAQRYRNLISDAATYDKILELLDADEAPQTILDITMQNHGGYKTNALPANLVKHHTIKGVDHPDLDEYLSLMDISDKALQEFIDKLSKLKRPVVLLLFGDHQPALAAPYNDALVTNDSSELVHQQRAHTTSYLMYANYDVAGTKTGTILDTSTNFLIANLAQLIGMPLSDFQKAQLVMQHQGMYAINMLGFQDSTGSWHDIKDNKEGDTAQLCQDLQTLQYLELFGDGVHYQVGSGKTGTITGRLQ